MGAVLTLFAPEPQLPSVFFVVIVSDVRADLFS